MAECYAGQYSGRNGAPQMFGLERNLMPAECNYLKAISSPARRGDCTKLVLTIPAVHSYGLPGALPLRATLAWY